MESNLDRVTFSAFEASSLGDGVLIGVKRVANQCGADPAVIG